MTPPPPSELPPDEKLARAKLDFINAAYAASPLRMVEKRPLASVGATAAATMAVTVIASSALFSRAGVSVVSRGFGLAGMVFRSKWAEPYLRSIIPKPAPPVGSPANAVG